MPNYNETKLRKIWDKANYCFCNSSECTVENHRTCPFCGGKMLWSCYWGNESKRNTFYSWNVEHIVPKRLGGTDELENLRAVHVNCNNDESNEGYTTKELFDIVE